MEELSVRIAPFCCQCTNSTITAKFKEIPIATEKVTITFSYRTIAIVIGINPKTTIEFSNGKSITFMGSSSSKRTCSFDKGENISITNITSNYGYVGVSIGDNINTNNDNTISLEVGGI